MARILVIDDDSSIREMLRIVLELEGHEVSEFSDGAQGVAAYADDPRDLIITDIVMPEQDGIETIFALRGRYPDVKIIALSGGGRIEASNYLAIARTIGASKTFLKPIDNEALVAAVDELVSL